MIYFLITCSPRGLAALCLALYRLRRRVGRAGGAAGQAVQDRQRALDFMHLMAEALGEGLSRQELHQRIVHASILCTGALSACIFERTAPTPCAAWRWRASSRPIGRCRTT